LSTPTAASSGSSRRLDLVAYYSSRLGYIAACLSRAGGGGASRKALPPRCAHGRHGMPQVDATTLDRPSCGCSASAAAVAACTIWNHSSPDQQVR